LRIQRENKRFKRRLEIAFSSEGKSRRGLTGDISLNGIFIKTNHAFPPGSPISMSLHLPDGSTAELKGTVMHAMKTPGISVKNGMGVRLLEKDKPFIEFMEEFEPVIIEKPSGPDVKTEPVTKQKADTSTEQKDPADFILLPCSSCKAKNRLLRTKVSKGPKCGKCGSSLVISLG
jgi:hypothetical protein